MLDLSILMVHSDPERVKGTLKRINWPKLNMKLAAVLSGGEAALTLMGQQTYHIVLADVSARCADGTPFLLTAPARHPESLFWAIGDPEADAAALLAALRAQNVRDYVRAELDPEEIVTTLRMGHEAYSRRLLGQAADRLLDPGVFDIPAALKKNLRATLRAILKDVEEGDLPAMAQDVAVLFHEVFGPQFTGGFDVAKAAAIELLLRLKYQLLTRHPEWGEELTPRTFIERIQCAVTNEDLEDICLYYLRRGADAANPGGAGQVSSLVRTAFAITRQRYADAAFSLVSLSDEIGISPNYLSSVFKMETGIRFKKYLNSYRIDRAKELLMDSRYKIYEVANLVGIEDSRYFSQIFRTYTGLKPSEYRNARSSGEYKDFE